MVFNNPIVSVVPNMFAQDTHAIHIYTLLVISRFPERISIHTHAHKSTHTHTLKDDNCDEQMIMGLHCSLCIIDWHFLPFRITKDRKCSIAVPVLLYIMYKHYKRLIYCWCQSSSFNGNPMETWMQCYEIMILHPFFLLFFCFVGIKRECTQDHNEWIQCTHAVNEKKESSCQNRM